MSGGNDKYKRGFSGLSDLASDVSGADNVARLEPSSPSPKPSQPATRPTSSNETKRKISGSIETIETVGSGKRGGGSGWKWILGVSAVIVVIWLASNEGQNTKRPSYNPPSPAPQSYDDRSTLSTLAREIENAKVRAKQLETQFKDMDDRLEEFERRMRSYRASGMTDAYNRLVPSFNSLISERNNLYENYSRLIDEINAKVSRYNSGYR